MLKHKFIRFLLFLQIIILITGCRHNPLSKDPKYYVVDITGIGFVFNISKSSFYFGSYPFNEDDTVSISVSEGDMLWIGTIEEYDVYYRYNPDDGLTLSFSDDTISEAVYFNNNIISINLNENLNAWKWIEQADEKELKKLKCLWKNME